MRGRHAKRAHEVKPALPIPMEQARDTHWEDITDNRQNDKVPAMLPLHERVILEVRYVRWSRAKAGVEYDPPNVGPQ